MEKHNIHVDIHEAYRYMGCRGTFDCDIENELRKAAELVEKTAAPRVIEKICALERMDGLCLSGTGLRLEGKAISALLHDCDLCAIFCATIGNDIEAIIRKWQLCNLAFTSMLDACASSAVESLCDSFQLRLSEEYAKKGFFLTDRFSPGYGDLPISIQPEFCAALDTSRKIGVNVSESYLMTPRKSVTAIIGISKNPQKHFEAGCRDCVLTNSCKFRENGVTCYGRFV